MHLGSSALAILPVLDQETEEWDKLAWTRSMHLVMEFLWCRMETHLDAFLIFNRFLFRNPLHHPGELVSNHERCYRNRVKNRLYMCRCMIGVFKKWKIKKHPTICRYISLFFFLPCFFTCLFIILLLIVPSWKLIEAFTVTPLCVLDIWNLRPHNSKLYWSGQKFNSWPLIKDATCVP